MELILASNSPRRRELLKEYGYDFRVISSDFNESENFRSPVKTVKSFAYGKAKAVFDKLNDKNVVVLGADTIVVFKGEILGKPKSQEHAKDMLSSLSGKTHTVITGFSLISKEKTVVKYVKSRVKFNVLSKQMIDEYVLTGKPMDKAGSYGIQDGFGLVKNYKGSLNNIIGLPIEKMTKIIDKMLKKQ